LSEDQKTKCVACANDIPQTARKCATCGSYQSFRRYLDISNVTLALAIAFLGLLTTLPATITGLNQTIKSTLAPDHSSRVMRLSNNVTTLYVRNNLDDDMLVANLVCVVYFARDSLYPIRSMARGLLEEQSTLQPQMQFKDVINPVMLAYRAEPQILQSGESSIFEFDYIGGVISFPMVNSNENVESFCSLNVDSNLPFEIDSAIPLEIIAYADFPLRELLAEIQILPSAQTTADEILGLLVGYDGSESLEQVFE